MRKALALSFAWLRRLIRGIDTSRSLGLAAEMAFWLFLSLMPLAAVAGLVAARLVLDGSDSLSPPFLESLPLATRDLLNDELSQISAWNSGRVGVSASVMFLWLSSSGVHAVFDGIELSSGAVARPWWRKRVMALGSCVALSLGVALLAVLGAGLGWLEQALGMTAAAQLAAEQSPIGKLVRMVLGGIVSLLLVWGLFWVAVPPSTRRGMPMLPGALAAIGMQTLVGLGFGLYLKTAGDGGAYQASLAAITVTMLALYLLCLAMLVGIEVNQILGEQHRRRPQFAVSQCGVMPHCEPESEVVAVRPGHDPP